MFHNYWRQVGEGGRAPSNHGPIAASDAAAAILQRLEELGPEGSGGFVQGASGEALPW